MEFLKHKAGVILLVVSLIVIVAVVWYLLFDMQGGGGYEGGTLVEGVRKIWPRNLLSACAGRNIRVSV